MSNKVVYVYSPVFGKISYGNSHAMKPVRISMTNSIVKGQGLYHHLNRVIPQPASISDMCSYHGLRYLEFLGKVNTGNVMDVEMSAMLDGYGLSTKKDADCPVFDRLFEFCSKSTGATIEGAKQLVDQKAEIAINWSGGLHHAKKNQASGFCYVNDIVIGIKTLQKAFGKVLYLDLDVHHGDGVQAAFYDTDKVMTVSFHRFEADFFPQTGSLREIGLGTGRFYSLNVPLFRGIKDEEYCQLFRAVFERIMTVYNPDAIVLQGGADSLLGDPLGYFNLTIKGHAYCVELVKKAGKPLLVLGGGGYDISNTAKCWAYETAVLMGKSEEVLQRKSFVPKSAIKSHVGLFKDPSALESSAEQVENWNSRTYLELLVQNVVEYLRMIPHEPTMLDGPSPAPAFSAESIGLLELDMEDRILSDFSVD